MEENLDFEQKKETMLQEINNIVYKGIDNLNKKISKNLEQLEKLKKLKNIKEEKEFLALYNDIKTEMQNIDNVESIIKVGNILKKENKKNSTENSSKVTEKTPENENIADNKTNIFEDNNKLVISEKERKSIFALQKRRG